MFCPVLLKENMHAQQEKTPPQTPEGGGEGDSMKQQQRGRVSALHTRINPDDTREFTKRPELDMDTIWSQSQFEGKSGPRQSSAVTAGRCGPDLDRIPWQKTAA